MFRIGFINANKNNGFYHSEYPFGGVGPEVVGVAEVKPYSFKADTKASFFKADYKVFQRDISKNTEDGFAIFVRQDRLEEFSHKTYQDYRTKEVKNYVRTIAYKGHIIEFVHFPSPWDFTSAEGKGTKTYKKLDERISDLENANKHKFDIQGIKKTVVIGDFNCDVNLSKQNVSNLDKVYMERLLKVYNNNGFKLVIDPSISATEKDSAGNQYYIDYAFIRNDIPESFIRYALLNKGNTDHLYTELVVR